MNAQLAHALALASAHGHFWASVVDKGEEPSWEEIEARCQAAFQKAEEDHGPGPHSSGITPSFDSRGALRHTTVTGRLSWTILSDGHVTFSVDRKDVGLVLISDVYLSRRGWVVMSTPADGLLRRHLWAWKDALTSLVSAGLLPQVEVDRAMRLVLPDVEDLRQELADAEAMLALDLDPATHPDPTFRAAACARTRAWIEMVKDAL